MVHTGIFIHILLFSNHTCKLEHLHLKSVDFFSFLFLAETTVSQVAKLPIKQ